MTGLLNIPGVIELETEDEPHHYVIHAKSEKPVGKACNLGCNLRRNGTKPLDINDVPHHGKATLIKFRRQQFSCPGCKNETGEIVGNDAISEILPFKEPGFLMTKRLVLWMARQAMRRTFAEIGRDAAVNPKSVAKAFDAYTSVEIAKLKRETPRVLGIDEKKLRGEFRAVLGNLEERTVLDMLKDRDATLEQKLIEMSADPKIEVIVTDRYEPYRHMVRDHMKGRLHVTDRFHVTMKANLILDKIRANVSKSLPDRRRGADLRMAAKLFKLRWHEAKPEQRDTLTAWGKEIPILHDAYWAKEHYCDMYLCSSPAEAERYYHAWMRDLPPSVSKRFQQACRIPPRWMPMVLAYFEEPYTTGYVESINRFLDDLQRDGRGYSFEVIRAKLMLAEKLERRTFRGKNKIGRIEIMPFPDELIGEERSYAAVDTEAPAFRPRYGIDLDKLRATLSEVLPSIVYGAKGRQVGQRISTLDAPFTTDPDQG